MNIYPRGCIYKYINNIYNARGCRVYRVVILYIACGSPVYINIYNIHRVRVGAHTECTDDVETQAEIK